MLSSGGKSAVNEEATLLCESVKMFAPSNKKKYILRQQWNLISYLPHWPMSTLSLLIGCEQIYTLPSCLVGVQIGTTLLVVSKVGYILRK